MFQVEPANRATSIIPKYHRQWEGKPRNSSRRDDFILTASASLPTTGSDRIRQLGMMVLKIDYSLDSLP